MNRPDYYCYPAILTYEEGREIAVTFPDLPGCATSGIDDSDALEMAGEALGGHLWTMEEAKEPIPSPTPLRKLLHAENEETILVSVYMPAIRLSEENRSVNRTVSLPAWLNARALEKHVNFSQVLQDALKKLLGLEKQKTV
ncbi:MAG: type II toxin-antitoxin system HicB family antitoxin [Lachnospiraceae bacterium]|nr:type II toxin-antitoxin system HicB family antitoxin [Lachnospiraceae bacterium]